MALLRGSMRAAIDAGEPVRTIIQAPTGFGKCLGRGTPVLMFDGTIIPVEDVVVGDLLMGPDSKPRKVLTTCRGREMLYRVTPVNGDSYVVNESHILSLKITGTQEVVNLTISDYLSRSNWFKHIAKGWRTSVDFHIGDDLLIDPYFLGLWLGDGLSRKPTICTGDYEIDSFVSSYAAELGLLVRRERNSNNSVNIHIHGGRRGGLDSVLLSALRYYDLERNKHVPIAFKCSARPDRLALLAGMIDTDGWRIKGGGFGLTLQSKKLMDDIVFVARSLGFSAYPRPVRKICCNNGVKGDYWVCSINGDVDQIPCRVARKIAPPRRQKKNVLLTGIKSVSSIGEGDYFGFEIDGDRLFMLGDFTVTHNTVLGAHIVNGSIERKQRVAFAVPMISIIGQTFERFQANGIDPGDMGVIQADHPWRRPHAPLQICSVATLNHRGFPDVKRVIVDECHVRFAAIDRWIKQRPDVQFIGLSATPWSKGLGEIWSDLVIPTTLRELIDDGELCKFRVFAASHPDLSGVKVVAGEYKQDQLSDVMSARTIVGDVVANWLTHGEGRPTLCFAVDRAHAAAIHDQFAAAGVQSAYVDGEMDRDEREAILKVFRRGEIKVINSVGTMTTGVDEDFRCIIDAQPTKSEIRQVQKIGRGLRLADGKADCLIFDHANNAAELGLVTNIHHERLRTAKTDAEEKQKRDRGDEKPAPKPHECARCHFMIPAGIRACPQCQYVPTKQSTVNVKEGELHEIGEKPKAAKLSKREIVASQGKQAVYSQLLAMQGTKKDGWVANQFREIFDVWPKGLDHSPMEPTVDLQLWIHFKNVKYAKGRDAERKRNQADQRALADAA